MSHTGRPGRQGFTLGELAVRHGCELRGDPALMVESVAPIGLAGPGSLTFLANPKRLAELRHTAATAVVLDAATVDESPVAALVVSNPHATYARIACELYPAAPVTAGVHPSAIIAASATIDASAWIGPHTVIGDGVTVGARVSVGPGCILEEGVALANDVRLIGRATICRDVRIGARSVVHPGAVIGSDGFGFANDRGTWLKVPQVGSVMVGDDVEIGANTTIDRGAIGDTIIEDGVKLDNQIQIGHNVRIGAHSALAACVGVSGSATIGKRCMIGGAAGIVGHLSICDDVAVTGLTMVSSSITEPGMYSSGWPAERTGDWRRVVARVKRVERLVERISKLERVGRDAQNVDKKQEQE